MICVDSNDLQWLPMTQCLPMTTKKDYQKDYQKDYLKRSIDLKWLFNPVLSFILRWSCFYFNFEGKFWFLILESWVVGIVQALLFSNHGKAFVIKFCQKQIVSLLNFGTGKKNEAWNAVGEAEWLKWKVALLFLHKMFPYLELFG